MKKKSLVYIQFPKTGLGNMLLLWARAVVFARLNHFELVTSPWWGFRWGGLLRRERKKRLYWKYFQETPISRRILASFYLKFNQVIMEPTVEKLAHALQVGSSLYLFNKIMTDYDLFGCLRDHHTLIVDELYGSLHPSKRSLLRKFEAPVIGIHIRRSDFKLGSTITPLAFFIKGINIIRQQVGEDWPVTVFTDAGKEEIAELLSLPYVKLAEEKADILDILLLSKSRVLLLSAGSTFSYWAAFLSNAFVVRPMNDWLVNIKTSQPQYAGYFEMKWQHDDELSTVLLRENIRGRQLKIQQ